MGTVPPVLPDNEAGWPFGELSDDEQLPDGTTAPWALAVRAGWLMRQPLAQETAQPADRAARRRLARAGLPDSGVRVIHIRRREHGPARPAGSRGTRQYGVQWWPPGTGGRTGAGPAAAAPRGSLDRSLSGRPRR